MLYIIRISKIGRIFKKTKRLEIKNIARTRNFVKLTLFPQIYLFPYFSVEILKGEFRNLTDLDFSEGIKSQDYLITF